MRGDTPPRDPATATIVVKATVTAVDTGRLLSLRPEKEDIVVQVEIDEKVRIRAQDKKEFDGRRRLMFDDLAVGQRLRVTVLPAQEKVVSLVVLKGGEWRGT